MVSDPKSHYHPEDSRRRILARVGEMRAAGASLAEACRTWGITEVTFYKWARQFGIDPVHRRGPVPPPEAQEEAQDEEEEDGPELGPDAGLGRALRRLGVGAVEWVDLFPVTPELGPEAAPAVPPAAPAPAPAPAAAESTPEEVCAHV